MYFTQSQIDEIARRLALITKRDSALPYADLPLDDQEDRVPIIQYIPALQDFDNRLISLADLRNIIDSDPTDPTIGCRLTVTCGTAGSTIRIHGGVRSVYDAYYGDVVDVVVSAPGYDTWFSAITMTRDHAINVSLSKTGRDDVVITMLSGLEDVSISSPSSGQLLGWNGSRWVNTNRVSYSGGSGIDISQSNVVSANIGEIAQGLIDAGYDLSRDHEATALRELTDVSIQELSEGQVLTFDTSIMRWVARTPQSGGGGVSSLYSLDEVNVNVATLRDGQILVYDGLNDCWVARTPQSGGTGYVTIDGPDTITGQKIFTLPITVGSITENRRIYFGDTSHYLELNSNGYYFCGGGVYSDLFITGGGLGQGGGGGASSLGGLDDVDLGETLVTGESLVYDGEKWTNAKLGLGGLEDVLISGTPATGSALVWNGTAWAPRPVSSSDPVNLDASGSGAADDSHGINFMNGNNKVGHIGGNNTGAIGIYANGDIVLRARSSSTGLNIGLSEMTFNNNPVLVGQATTGALGGFKLSRVKRTPDVASGSFSYGDMSGRYYGVEMNNAGQLYVNVPWTSSSSGSSVTWGTPANNTVPLTVDGNTKTLLLSTWSPDLSGYLPLTAGSGNALIDNLYMQGAVPTTNGAITINQTTGVITLGDGYDLGDASHAFRALRVNAIYLGKNTNNLDVYMYYDRTNNCVRVKNAGIVSDYNVTGGRASTN